MAVNERKVRLSSQVALLGVVTDNLRAVNISSDASNIYVYFYFDGEIPEEDADIVSTEIISDIDRDEEGNVLMIETIIVRLDYPNEIPDTGFRVYQRKE